MNSKSERNEKKKDVSIFKGGEDEMADDGQADPPFLPAFFFPRQS
jgi:hypothetical protein